MVSAPFASPPPTFAAESDATGVPRILEGTLPPHFEGRDVSSSGEDDWEIYEEYLRGTRVNVNVRQVFPKGFDPMLYSTGTND